MKWCSLGTLAAGGMVIASVFPVGADTLWIFGGGQSLYSTVQISDTENIVPPFTDGEDDTGINFNDTTLGHYFDFDYRFNNNPVLPESTAVALFWNTGIDSGLSSGKGWAGFKVTWEHRGFSWNLSGYNALMIKHKSSIPTHKADIFFGLCNNPYDSALIDSIGTIAADTGWTTTTIPIPPPGNVFDSTEGFTEAQERQYVSEIRFLIHNVPGYTDSVSAPGNFFLDEIGVTRIAPLVSPVNNAHQQPLQLTLSWGSAPGAVSYGVQVSEASNFSSTVVSLTGLTATSATVTGLADNETYYWRTNVTDSTSTNAWTAAWEFGTVTTASTSKNCGCGSGTGLALLPPLWLKAMSRRRRKKRA